MASKIDLAEQAEIMLWISSKSSSSELEEQSVEEHSFELLSFWQLLLIL